MSSPADESTPSKKNNTLLSVLNSRLDDINESLQKIWDNITACKERFDNNEVQNSYVQNTLVGAAEASMALRAARDIMSILIAEEK